MPPYNIRREFLWKECHLSDLIKLPIEALKYSTDCRLKKYLWICWWRICGLSLCYCEGKFGLLEVGSLTHLSLWKSLSFSIQGKKSCNAHYEKWKAREEGKQYVPYSHMMVGVYSLWKTSDGFLQLRKQLTAKKKLPPSRAMDEPDLRPLRARCLHWSTSLGEDGLCSKARKGIQQEVEPAVNDQIHWRDHHTFYSQFNKRSVLRKRCSLTRGWSLVD